MSNEPDKIQEVVSEAVSLVPALMDGDISSRDRMRLIRLFFDLAEIAVDLYDQQNNGGETVSRTAVSDGGRAFDVED